MPKAKYDWPSLHTEFLDSEYDEVTSFFKRKWIAYNRHTQKQTKWWTKEKQEMKNKAMIDATENILKKTTKNLEIPMEQLTIAKRNAVIMVMNKIKEMNDDKKNPPDLNDLERIIKILRTEMWLPITYSKNENLNMEKFEWINIIWKAPNEE